MFGMKVEPGELPFEYTVTTNDGRPIRRDQTQYWARVVFRAHYLRDIRTKLDAEFDRLVAEADARRKGQDEAR